ncbi:methyltransferase [Halorarius litoreus]|uniref:methyltransferase n=1 Tax=Halorarius litoreus TaxID=2962676 RepID=UPI0020CDB562|nr:methyltransferase [Halorarius litoreus]
MTDDALPTGARELLVLWAARECEVLDALATSAGTPEDVATETGITPVAADTLVTALADRGLVEQVGDEYEPTNRLLGFLTKTDLRSIGRLPHALDTFDAWLALPETARTGTPPDPSEYATRNELGTEWSRDDTTVRATVTAAVRAHPDADSVVVLRDGPGRHAREFLARGFEVTLVETPERADAAAPLLRPTEVRLETGGYVDSIPQTDLVCAVDLTRRHTPEENRAWLRAAQAALEPGGAVVAVEPLRDHTPDAALLDVETLATGGARISEEATVREWFENAGFALDLEPVPGTDRVALVGRRVQ